MKGRLVLIMWDGDPECRACGLRDAGWFVELAARVLIRPSL
jgi:hypothetical protein